MTIEVVHRRSFITYRSVLHGALHCNDVQLNSSGIELHCVIAFIHKLKPNSLEINFCPFSKCLYSFEILTGRCLDYVETGLFDHLSHDFGQDNGMLRRMNFRCDFALVDAIDRMLNLRPFRREER